MRTDRIQFLLLSCLGLWGLWGLAYFDGMFDRLDKVMRTRTLPDGRPLRDSYLGIGFLDEQLTLLSAFYDLLTNTYSSGPRLLFFEINFVVACTNLWAVIEGQRRGTRNWFLKYPAWAIVLWNANGAAIVQPIYFYLLTRSKARTRDPTIPLNHAIAAFITTIPIMLHPVLLFAPPWMGASSWQHHGYIAAFHCAPLLIMTFHLLLSSLLRPRVGHLPKGAAEAEARKWTMAAFILAGTVAAAVHMYTVLGALLTTDPDTTLTRIFVASHGRSNPFPSFIKTLPSTTNGVPEEYSALLENFHLFSQYDWIVVSLSCIVFTHLLLWGREGEVGRKPPLRGESQDLVYLSLATLFLGPGAAGSFALAMREARLGRGREPVHTNGHAVSRATGDAKLANGGG